MLPSNHQVTAFPFTLPPWYHFVLTKFTGKRISVRPHSPVYKVCDLVSVQPQEAAAAPVVLAVAPRVAPVQPLVPQVLPISYLFGLILSYPYCKYSTNTFFLTLILLKRVNKRK